MSYGLLNSVCFVDTVNIFVLQGNASKYVKLNVGGMLFHTTIGTLTKLDNMLRAMFSGRIEVLTDVDGMFLQIVLY